MNWEPLKNVVSGIFFARRIQCGRPPRRKSANTPEVRPAPGVALHSYKLFARARADAGRDVGSTRAPEELGRGVWTRVRGANPRVRRVARDERVRGRVWCRGDGRRSREDVVVVVVGASRRVAISPARLKQGCLRTAPCRRWTGRRARRCGPSRIVGLSRRSRRCPRARRRDRRRRGPRSASPRRHPPAPPARAVPARGRRPSTAEGDATARRSRAARDGEVQPTPSPEAIATAPTPSSPASQSPRASSWTPPRP